MVGPGGPLLWAVALLLLLALLAAVGSTPEADPGPEAGPAPLVAFTRSMLEARGAGLRLVQFMAPWCPASRALEPELRKVAAHFGDMVAVGTVDCTAEGPLCDDFGVKAFPAVFLLRGLQRLAYSGAHSFPPLKDFVERYSGHHFVLLEKAEQVQPWRDSLDVGVVAVIPSLEHPDFGAFAAFAKEAREADGLSLAVLIDPTAHCRVSVFKAFDERQADWAWESPLDAEGLRKFVTDHTTPLLVWMGTETYGAVRDSGLPLSLLFLDPATPTSDVEAAFATVARRHQDRVMFVLVDGPANTTLADWMGLSGRPWPAVAVEDLSGRAYVMSNQLPLTSEAIDQFIAEFLLGHVPPLVRSELPATEEVMGPHVQAVVGSTFRRLVTESKKDVLLHVHAPWCGYCKALRPVFHALAHWLQNVPTVLVAEIDGTKNTVPLELTVDGFPTVLFLAANGSVTEYRGPRSLDRLAGFILDHVSIPIDVQQLSFAPGSGNPQVRCPVDDTVGEEGIHSGTDGNRVRQSEA